jgi:hypothetical protein
MPADGRWDLTRRLKGSVWVYLIGPRVTRLLEYVRGLQSNLEHENMPLYHLILVNQRQCLTK